MPETPQQTSGLPPTPNQSDNPDLYRKGWLRRVLDEAATEIATWPDWKREMMQDALAPPPPDPCRCKRQCDEAQTCIGGCVYGR